MPFTKVVLIDFSVTLSLSLFLHIFLFHSHFLSLSLFPSLPLLLSLFFSQFPSFSLPSSPSLSDPLTLPSFYFSVFFTLPPSPLFSLPVSLSLSLSLCFWIWICLCMPRLLVPPARTYTRIRPRSHSRSSSTHRSQLRVPDGFSKWVFLKMRDTCAKSRKGLAAGPDPRQSRVSLSDEDCLRACEARARAWCPTYVAADANGAGAAAEEGVLVSSMVFLQPDGSRL
jgi:hypothetical protein